MEMWKHHKERRLFREIHNHCSRPNTPFEIGDHFNLKEKGTLSINLIFKSPLAATINELVYAEYDNVIEIDSNRNLIKDWNN